MQWKLFDIRWLRDDDYAHHHSLMCEEQKARIARMHRAEDRKRSVCGEMLARAMISERCHISPDSVVIKRRADGKPYTEDIALHFSISHAGMYVVCVVDDTPVGVDIEKIRPLSSAVIRHVCPNAQLGEYILPEPSDDTPVTDASVLRLFFETWTRQEAVYKCGCDDCVVTYPEVQEDYVLCIAQKAP